MTDTICDEIEITPAMLMAGVMAYYENNGDGWDNPGAADLREMVCAIFRAMTDAKTGFRTPPAAPHTPS